MRRLLILAATLCALAAVWPAGGAGAATRRAGAGQAHWPVVGFGEQRPGVFSNQHWQALGLPHTRLVVGWDALRYRWQTREIDHWMAAARVAGAVPLVAFTRSRADWRRRMLPRPRVYRRHFLKFRKRYPWVKDYVVWNEANHCSQPLCHRPEIAARYFDQMRRSCWSCRIVAADVLDSTDMEWWLRRFRRSTKYTPRIWGLHNYLDANYFRTHGTRTMLRTVKGQIWMTETGGVVKRRGDSPHRFRESPSHAARAVNYLFRRIVPLSPRIRRVYLYHFQNQGPEANWDSGVLDPYGRPRPAYNVVTRYLARAERARRTR